MEIRLTGRKGVITPERGTYSMEGVKRDKERKQCNMYGVNCFVVMIKWVHM